MNKYANGTISFTTNDSIEANKPVLLKATTAGTTYTLEGRKLETGTPTVEGTHVSMVGTYNQKATIPTDNNYVIATKNGEQKFYLVDSSLNIKNTRAYFHVVESSSVKASLMMSFDDGMTTGIGEIDNGQLTQDNEKAVYNLAGQRVSASSVGSVLPKGLYIVNGKKVVIK